MLNISEQLDNTSTPIHVALAVYDPTGTYSQHAGVVMASIFENTRSPVIVHVLHDETLTEANRRKFLRTAEKYGQTVDFVDVKEYREKLNRDAITLVENYCSIGTLYRLFIPNLLDMDRLIYLDCDVVVNLDIRELWETDLEGRCLGGVPDRICGKSSFSHDALCAKFNGCPIESYINAGVLLMDLNRIREWGNLTERALAWFSRHKHSAIYADQDALNAFFTNSIKLIAPKFNYFSFSREPGQHKELMGQIVHFIAIKPWRELRGLATERLYWGHYLLSAWGENITSGELIDILSRTASLSPQIHRHTKQCYQQIGRRLAWDVLHVNFFRIVWLLIQEACCRIKRRFL